MATMRRYLFMSKSLELVMYLSCLIASYYLYEIYGDQVLTPVLYFTGLIGIVVLSIRVIIAKIKSRHSNRYQLRDSEQVVKGREFTESVYWRLFKVVYVIISVGVIINSINVEDGGIFIVGAILLSVFLIIKKLTGYVLYGAYKPNA